MQQKITQEHIDSMLDEAQTQEHIFWDKELLVSYKLKNGFTITGRGAVVDPKYFNIDLGRKTARQDASNQLWRYEGYRLQLKLAEESL